MAEINNEDDLYPSSEDSLDVLKENAKEELVEELNLEEAPKSIAEKQLSEISRLLDSWVDDVIDEIENGPGSVDGIIARRYASLLSEYKIVMKRDLWTISQSGLIGESFSKVPGFGFFQPFLDAFLEGLRESKESNKNAETLLKNIDEVERQLGSSHREVLEDMLEKAESDKELGRYILILYTAHHEGLKRAYS